MLVSGPLWAVARGSCVSRLECVAVEPIVELLYMKMALNVI